MKSTKKLRKNATQKRTARSSTKKKSAPKKPSTKSKRSAAIFSLLRTDHQRVSTLLDEMTQKETADESLEGLFLAVQRELEMHAVAEERVLYPMLANYRELVGAAAEAEEEHEGIWECLAELEGLSVEDEMFSKRLSELKRAVESHVDEEENEIFAKMRKVISAADLAELGERFQIAKEELLEEPIAA